jgi:hypothetical protein
MTSVTLITRFLLNPLLNPFNSSKLLLTLVDASLRGLRGLRGLRARAPLCSFCSFCNACVRSCNAWSDAAIPRRCTNAIACAFHNPSCITKTKRSKKTAISNVFVLTQCRSGIVGSVPKSSNYPRQQDPGWSAFLRCFVHGCESVEIVEKVVFPKVD